MPAEGAKETGAGAAEFGAAETGAATAALADDDPAVRARPWARPSAAGEKLGGSALPPVREAACVSARTGEACAARLREPEGMKLGGVSCWSCPVGCVMIPPESNALQALLTRGGVTGW